jgi:type II secretory pathway pseudopilin PulG
MAIRIKPWNCRFRSSKRGPANSHGLVLIVVMMVAVLLLISLTATLPSVYQEGQREREAELIFRGTQYARAVALFHRQFNRFPVSTKELLQTNGVRFLRQEYRDPMDPKGKWRFIHVNASGTLLDSKNQPMMNPNGNPAGVGFGNSNPGSSFSNPTAGSAFSSSSPMGAQSQSGFGGFGSSSSTSGSSQFGPTPSFFGNSNQIQGAFIAGVAATSHHESIQVWKKHHHYDEWEFIGIDMGVFGVQVGLDGGSPGMPGQQVTSPNSGFSQGTSFGTANPTSNPSSFGPSPN